MSRYSTHKPFLKFAACSFLLFAFCYTMLVQGQYYGNNGDFLEQVFAPSKGQQQVINIGNDKQAVGNEVLRSSTTIGVDLTTADPFDVATQEPLIVRLTKFLLRITIALAITMVIYTGIRYIWAAGSEEGMTKARENLYYIVGGILIALMSYGIILLLQSITFSTLSAV